MGLYSKNARLTNQRTGLLRILLGSAGTVAWGKASPGVMVTTKAGTRHKIANKLSARRISSWPRITGMKPPVIKAANGTKTSPKLADAALLPRKARGMSAIAPTLNADPPKETKPRLSQVAQTSRLRL